MKQILISSICALLLTVTLSGQASTESSPGTLLLRNGSQLGVNLNSGGPFLSASLSGFVAVSDGSNVQRVSIFGGQQLDPDTNPGVPLIKLTGTVPGASKTFMKFLNDDSNESWNFNMSQGSNLTGTQFEFVWKLGSSSTTPVTISSTGGISSSSDRRLKTNINTIESALPSLMKLNAKHYNRKIDLNKEEFGFIAQEVEKVFPDMVSVITKENGDEQYMMNYTQLIPILTKSVQEQQEVIQDQSELIARLSKRLAAVEARL